MIIRAKIAAQRDTLLAFVIFCVKCDQFKDYSLFDQVSKKSLRPAFACNDCKREYQQTYQKAYRDENKGKPPGRKKAKRTKEEKLQQMRDYYQRNKESLSQQALQYRELNKEKLMLSAMERRRVVSVDPSLWKKWRLTRMLSSAKNRAKRQGVDFDLTIDYLLTIASDNCPVDGFPMEWRVNKEQEAGPAMRTPSLDKVIPSLGYTKGNVQVICWQYNSWKRNMLVDDMRTLLSYLQGEQK